MEIIILFISLWYGGLFFQTFFLHRYAAHQSFTMSKTAEKISFILTWFFQGTNYLSAYGYGVMHRMHHAYADTPKDPHSPKYDQNIFSMMWRTYKNYQNINGKKIKIENKFTKNVPQWPLFDRFAGSNYSRLSWFLLYLIFFAFYASSVWLWLFFPLIILMAPIHGAIINWFAHKYGYRNFEVNDTSKNLLPLDLVMFGEAYHNNHHKFSHRANFGGIKWFEIDPAYQIMRTLDKIGIIQLNRK